jgi:hypothetical protein
MERCQWLRNAVDQHVDAGDALGSDAASSSV